MHDSIKAPGRGARTFLVHLPSGGLADVRYAVTHFRSRAEAKGAALYERTTATLIGDGGRVSGIRFRRPDGCQAMPKFHTSNYARTLRERSLTDTTLNFFTHHLVELFLHNDIPWLCQKIFFLRKSFSSLELH